MINRTALLKDLQRLLPKIEKDILAYSEQNAELTEHLNSEYTKAVQASRTAEHFIDWREAQITQAAVAWLLTCVFVRFLEDNQLLNEPVLAGAVEKADGTKPLAHAKERMVVYFNENPTHAEREYLLSLFADLEKNSVVAELLDHKHNPLWQIPISADGAKSLIDFFQKIEPSTGDIIHDFADDQWDTRFLGDLYQDLSESVRKRYALLQTPEFVESFILDYTLEKAKETFGLEGLRLIDPTCGSGHFLLTTFERVFNDWLKREPATNTRVLAQRALDVVHGVDINPYAIAICRFRLFVAAMKAAGSTKINNAPDFHFNLACGDSLLHGKRFEWQGQGLQGNLIDADPLQHVLEVEDRDKLDLMLGQQYHAVVGNPPYIVVKDSASRESIRKRYPNSCFGKYGMGAPFTERFFDLCLTTEGPLEAGFVGIITTNAFMKREWGKKIIENYLPRKDLSHILDTSGAYIPGHGTPTVIMFGRNRKPVRDQLKVSLGIRGEPSKPKVPSEGLVWNSIIENVEKNNFENEFITVASYSREMYAAYPWSLIGGGAIELKEHILNSSTSVVNQISKSIGPASFPGIDEVFVADYSSLKRWGVDEKFIKPFVSGEYVRDWAARHALCAFVPYDENFKEVHLFKNDAAYRHIWAYRCVLESIVSFGQKTRKQIGQTWYAWYRWIESRFQESYRICFPSMGTHNHFTLVENNYVFNRHAPLIILNVETEDDFFSILGYLNSSVACFMLKQFCFNKGDSTDSEGARTTGEPEFDTYEFSASHLGQIPIFINKKVSEYARKMVECTKALRTLEVPYALARDPKIDFKIHELKLNLLKLQESIDWEIYKICDLLDANTEIIEQPSNMNVRPFEYVLADKIKKRIASDSWFTRHGRNLPEDDGKELRDKIEIIQNNRFIKLLEDPKYKRRWVDEGFNAQIVKNIRKDYLLSVLEETLIQENILLTCAILADKVRSNPEFIRVVCLYLKQEAPDIQIIIEELVHEFSVPQIASIRFKKIAMPKFRAWQDVWGKQRKEDLIDAEFGLDTQLKINEDELEVYELSKQRAALKKASNIGDFSIPPQYSSADFRSSVYWQLRGKLDIPKECFFSLPGCEKDGDSTLVIGWAGMNHLQRAQAISAWYLERKDTDGWEAEKLKPMLVALDELIPWLKQWHNEVDPEYGERMGDFYEGFLIEELRLLDIPREDLLTWEPVTVPKKVAAKKSPAKKIKKSAVTE